MVGYGSHQGCFSSIRQLLNGVATQFGVFRHKFVNSYINEMSDKKQNQLKNTFEENFMMSVMVMCIKAGIFDVNKSLKTIRKEPCFKLLYSPSVVNLLSLLNTFRRSEYGVVEEYGTVEEDGMELSDYRLLKENAGSFLGCVLKRRGDFLNDLDERMNAFRNYVNVDTDNGITDHVRNSVVNNHKNIATLQSKMYVVQVLFDLYKLISIELHHQTDYESKEYNHDFSIDVPRV